jgi:hypothetical protein
LSLPCSSALNCLTYTMWKSVAVCENCRYFNADTINSEFKSIDGEKHLDDPSRKRHKPRKGPSNIEKVKSSKLAKESENKAVNVAVKAAKNSGRSHQDGDFSIGNIGVDNKKQSKSKNITIKMEEIDKAKADAKRSGKTTGVLRVENEDNRSFYVIEEQDFLRMFM